MRYAGIAFSVLLFSLASGLSQAGVLLPENTPQLDSYKPKAGTTSSTTPTATRPSSSSTATTSSAQSQGLVNEPVVAPVASSQATVSASTEVTLDKVNKELLNALSSSEAQESMPAEMKNLSQDDYKSLLSGKSSSTLMQKLKGMGTAFSGASSLAVTGPISITPGGTLGKAPLSKKDIMAAKLLEMGIAVNENAPVSPAVQKARDYAAKAREKHARTPIYANNYEIGGVSATDYSKPFLIGVLPDYMWGEGDVTAIHEALGYEREDIPKKCQVRLKVQMSSDDNYSAYNLYMFTGEQKTGSYNGVLGTLSTNALAVCYPPLKEANTGVVVLKHGDKQAIQLGQGSCTVPVRKSKDGVYEPTSAGVRYTGDGKIACGFR